MGQAHALANLFYLLAPALGLFGLLLLANLGRHVSPTALILYGLGFALFVIAKLSLILSGRLITFGSRFMHAPYRVLYRLRYGLMAAGARFTLGLMIAAAMTSQ
jgi:hypothetical protein